MNPLTNRDITGRFEVRLSEYTGRRYWWGWEGGWKDATEIGENGVLTLDAAAFELGTVITLTEPFAHGERASFHQLDIALDALTRIMTKAAELDDQTIARIVRRAIVTIQGER